MRGLGHRIGVACAGVMLVLPAWATASVTTRVSVRSDGTENHGGRFRTDARAFWISGNGRYVAFSGTPFLVPIPPRPCFVPFPGLDCRTVYIHDRSTGRVEVVSRSYDGRPLNGSSEGGAMSGDGRYVAFSSWATNVIAPGPDLSCAPNTICSKVYVRDRVLGTNELISVSEDGEPANDLSYFSDISDDGRFVGYSSYATNLIPGVNPDGHLHSYVYDRATGETSLVSTAPSGEPANKRVSYSSSLSGDGRFVAFSSDADNLVENDTNSRPNSFPDYDVFVKDRATGAVLRANIATDGTQADNYADNASISGDGRFVVFTTRATHLVPEDTNFQCSFSGSTTCNDVFVHDLVERTTELISRSTSGEIGDDDSTPSLAVQPSISYDGRFVAFTSEATNLDPPWSMGGLFVRDRVAQTTERLDIAMDGGPAEFPADRDTAMSHDGRFIVFSSHASNLVPGDTNGDEDIFVHDRTCANFVVDPGEQCDDGNGEDGDECTSLCTIPACRGGGVLESARVRLLALGHDPIRARLVLRGRLRLPAVPEPFDPVARGAQVLVEDVGANHRALVDLTADTVPVPPHGFGCDRRDGWRTWSGGRIRAYRNRSNRFFGRGCAPGTARGIELVRFDDDRDRDGTIGFVVRASSSLLEPVVGPLRVAIVVGGTREDGANGLCGGRTFESAECEVRRGGTRLVCGERRQGGTPRRSR